MPGGVLSLGSSPLLLLPPLHLPILLPLLFILGFPSRVSSFSCLPLSPHCPPVDCLLPLLAFLWQDVELVTPQAQIWGFCTSLQNDLEKAPVGAEEWLQW